MQPIYENIQPNPGHSFYLIHSSPGCCEPFWHIHPEYELVYIKSGSAERNIGGNVSRYFEGDLLLIGSNIPHSNLGNGDHPDNLEIVVQFSVDFAEKQIASFPEFSGIVELFNRSLHGISFSQNVKIKAHTLLVEMIHSNPFKKLLKLLDILQLLATSNEYTLLNSKSATIEVQSNDYSRINRINDFVASNYHKQIHLKELAELACLTESSFSRFFKRVTGKTFISFLNEYRVQKACSFLANKNSSIGEIMSRSGFLEPAHFTRTFKKYTNHTPRDYRRKLGGWM